MKKHKLQTINNKRDLAFSIDALYPGLYVWFKDFTFKLGGVMAGNEYNFVMGRDWGFAIIITYNIYFIFPSLKQFKRINNNNNEHTTIT
jgi:hypothetical protein